MTNTTRTLSMLFKPAADVPGDWVAHVLDFNTFSYGHSLEHALQSALEATAIVVQSDAAIGRDPDDRRAPAADWQELRDVFQHGQHSASVGDVGSAGVVAIIVPCTIPLPAGRQRRTAKPKMAAPLAQSFQAAA